jgi:hypothetical protein
MMKALLLQISITVFAIQYLPAQVQIDASGNTIFRNSSTSGWSGTTNLTLGASSVQNSGLKFSYEADPNPRVGRITLNNSWGGIYGDFAISLRTASGIFERLRIKSNGNVGIGTSLPTAKLEIEEANGALLRLSNDANNYLYSGIDASGAYIEQVSNNSSKSKIRFQVRNANQGSYSQFFLNGENNSFSFINGKTGIGTSSPNGLLEIVGPYTGHSQLIINTTQSNGELRFSDNNITKGFVWYSQSSDHMAFGRGGITTSMFVNTSGQFGIGTKTTGSHKLAVEGTISAREVKVETTVWPDYVFKDDYKLRSLEEVEQHIDQNGHLPEIPSAADVTENGILLGEMNAKLLQKIEELTLYMIEQNKQNQRQQTLITDLENRLAQIESR